MHFEGKSANPIIRGKTTVRPHAEVRLAGVPASGGWSADTPPPVFLNCIEGVSECASSETKVKASMLLSAGHTVFDPKTPFPLLIFQG